MSPIVVVVLLAVSVLGAPTTATVVVGSVGLVSSGGGFESLDPFRVLDTRFGTGAPAGKVGPGESLTLDVTGVGGVPESGVGAVVVNVTVTEPTASSHLRVHPSGTALPLAANLNWSAGQTIPNLVIAKVGADGNIVLYNDNGSSHFVADIAGWFPSGSEYSALDPFRVLDTRFGTGAPAGKVGPGESLTLDVTGVGGVPESGVGAVVVNVTVTEPTASSHLRVHPSGTALPLAANLNWSAGDTIPNLVIAKVGADGNIVLYNDNGSSHFVADIAGWFPSGSEYSALDPFRVLDTRFGTGAPAGKVGPGESLTLDVTGVGGVPESGVGAVVVNVTVTEPTASSHLRVHPSGTALPLAANLNWSAGDTIPNLVIAKVGADGNIVLYNDNGSSHYVADIAGWFPEGPTTVRASVDSSGGEGVGGRGASNDPTLSGDGALVAFHSQADRLVPEDDDGAQDIFVKNRTTGAVELISVDSDENNGFAASFDPEITPDGRYVVWESNDANLVDDDTNSRTDIFVRDRVAGTTEIVSVDATGDEGDGHSYDADISDDGRYVTFMSYATDLVAGDVNGHRDIFVHDRDTSTTTKISVDSSGVAADAGSDRPAISGDGAYVAFDSHATNLVTGDANNQQDIFLHHLASGATTRVSLNSLGDEAGGQSYFPEIDGSGRYVAFESSATNLIVDGGVVQADANGTFNDVFVHDRVTGDTTIESVDSDEVQSLTYSGDADISADGTRVTYTSNASLTANDLNGFRDIYVRDRTAGTTTLASVDAAGDPGNGTSDEPAISADGTVVGFSSAATGLDIVDDNVVDDVFVHVLSSSTTEQVSTDAAGAPVYGPGGSFDAQISGNGRFVAFDSQMPNLVPDDTDDHDVFIRDLETGVTELVSVDSDEQAGIGTSYDPAIDQDGSVVAFASYTDLVDDDDNNRQDIYVRDRAAGTTERVSVHTDGTEGDNNSFDPDVSADGRFVVFRSSATNLVDGDTNGSGDIFVHDRDTGVTERVSVDENGAEVADSHAFQPSISGNGRFVAFRAISSGFVSGDTNSGYDIFVHDRMDGSTSRVSVDALGNEASGSSHTPSLDHDGSHIVFQSSANDLVVGDSHSFDVFIKNLNTGIVELVSVDSDEVHVVGSSYDPQISALGTSVVFSSIAAYSPLDSGTDSDIYVRDINAGTTTLVSVNVAGQLSDGISFFPTVNSDGSVVAFESDASDLVAGDTNGTYDVFVRSPL